MGDALLGDRQHGYFLQLGHSVAAADEVRGERQRQGVVAHHPDVTRGLAAHPVERVMTSGSTTSMT
jgi:hypothetical protein